MHCNWAFFQYIYTPVTWGTVTEIHSKTFTLLLPGVLSLRFLPKHLHSCYLVYCISGFSSDTFTLLLPGVLYHWVFITYIYTPVTWCTVTELSSKTFTLLLPGALYHWIFNRHIDTLVTWYTVTGLSSNTFTRTLLLPGALSLGFFPKTFTLMLPGVLYHWVFIRYITVLLPGALYHWVFVRYITVLLPGALSLNFLPKHLHSCYMVHCVIWFSLNPLIAVSPCGLCNWVFIWCNSQSFYLLSTRFSPDPFSHFSW